MNNSLLKLKRLKKELNKIGTKSNNLDYLIQKISQALGHVSSPDPIDRSRMGTSLIQQLPSLKELFDRYNTIFDIIEMPKSLQLNNLSHSVAGFIPSAQIHLPDINSITKNSIREEILSGLKLFAKGDQRLIKEQEDLVEKIADYIFKEIKGGSGEYSVKIIWGLVEGTGDDVADDMTVESISSSRNWTLHDLFHVLESINNSLRNKIDDIDRLEIETPDLQIYKDKLEYYSGLIDEVTKIDERLKESFDSLRDREIDAIKKVEADYNRLIQEATPGVIPDDEVATLFALLLDDPSKIKEVLGTLEEINDDIIHNSFIEVKDIIDTVSRKINKVMDDLSGTIIFIP